MKRGAAFGVLGVLAVGSAHAEMAKLQVTRLPAAAQLNVPVLLDSKLTADDVKPTIAFVQRGDIPADPALFQQPTLTAGPDGSHLATLQLPMTVANLPPGTFSVGLEFNDQRKKAGLKPMPAEVAKLEVVQAAAKLGAPSSVVLVCDSSCAGRSVTFALRETSKAAAISGLALAWAVSAVPDGVTPAERITCLGPNQASVVDIPAGGQVDVTCRSEAGDGAERFPIGTTTGVLSLRAEPLGDVPTIPMEIHVRSPWWVLPLLLAIGVAVGAVVRGGLQKWLQRARAKERVEEFRQALDQAAAHTADPIYVGEAQRISEALRKAAAKGEDLEAALREATAEKSAADSDLKARFTSASADLAAEEQFVLQSWTVPPALVEPLAALRAAVASARESLAAGNVQAAATGLDGLGPLRNRLGAATATWVAGISSAIASLDKPVRDRIAEVGGDAFTQLGSVGQQTDPKQSLPIASNLLLRLTPYVPNLLASVRPRLERAYRKIHDRQKMDPGGVAEAKLGEALRLMAAANSLELQLAALKEWREAEQTLKGVLETAVDSRQQDADDARQKMKESLAKLLEDGRYDDAVDFVMTPQGHLGDAAAVPPGAPVGMLRAPLPAGARVEPPAAETKAPVAQPPPIRVPDRRLVAGVSGAVTLFAGAGIVAVGTALFIGDFVGFPKQIIEALAWGFGANVSVDALVTAANGLKKPA